MPARISREHLSDESLRRAKKMLTAQISMFGTLIHRYQGNPEVAYEMGRDDDALSDVLGILLHEARMRKVEDAELKEDE